MNADVGIYAKKKRSRLIWRIVLLSILVLALLGVAGYFAANHFFIVKTVTVQETSLYPAEAILEKVGIPAGTPLHKVSKEVVKASVEENFPYLVNVTVEFDLPHAVLVSFAEDHGIFSLTLGEELFAVNESLCVVSKESKDSSLRRIRLYSDDVSRCIVGEELAFFDETGRESLASIVQALKKEDFLERIGSIDLRDKFNIRLTLEDRFTVLIGDGSELAGKLAMLRGVLEDLSATATGRIDLTDHNNAYVKLDEVE